MKNLTNDEVKSLYVTADHHSKDHVRLTRNEAEFDAWLEAHDAEVRIVLLENLMGILGPIEKQVSMSTAQPIFNALDKYVEDIRRLAAEVGVEVTTTRAR